MSRARDAVELLIAAIVAPGFVSLAGKVLWPRRRMPLRGRAAVFLVLTLALGPGILANVVLKDHWGRIRPIDVAEFGGSGRFTPWWDPRSACAANCSFIAGEPSGAFWTLAPAALAPPQWRPLAYGAALVFGAGIGVGAQGGINALAALIYPPSIRATGAGWAAASRGTGGARSGSSGRQGRSRSATRR